PECHIDGGNRRHCYRPATPICTAIEILPDVFGLKWIPSDQTRYDMFFKIGRDGQLPAIESGVTQTQNSFIGLNFERHKVSTRTADKDFCGGDFQFDLVSRSETVLHLTNRRRG